MRRNTFLISIITAAGCIAPAACGQLRNCSSGDGKCFHIALDESRGKLYIAATSRPTGSTCSRPPITPCIPPLAHLLKVPSSMALSPDSRFLLVTNYGPNSLNGTTITLIDLTSNSQQNFSTGNPPLGVAFFSERQRRRTGDGGNHHRHRPVRSPRRDPDPDGFLLQPGDDIAGPRRHLPRTDRGRRR